MSNISIEEIESIYTDEYGLRIFCIHISKNNGKLNNREIYETLEKNINQYDDGAFVQIYSVSDEAPASLYDAGDDVYLIPLEQFCKNAESYNIVPLTPQDGVCRVCGGTVDDDDNYCRQCGKRLKE